MMTTANYHANHDEANFKVECYHVTRPDGSDYHTVSVGPITLFLSGKQLEDLEIALRVHRTGCYEAPVPVEADEAELPW